MVKFHKTLFLFIMILVLSGCGYLESYQDKNIVNQYIDRVNELNETQHHILSNYNEKFVNEENNEKAIGALKEEVLPDFKNFLKNVKKVDAKTNELEEIHKLYIEAMRIQLEVFDLNLRAFETENQELIDKSNALVDEIEVLLNKHKKQVINY